MSTDGQGAPVVTRERFGETANGEAVDRITLESPDGLVVRVLTYGGIISELRFPDGTDAVLGYSTMDEYLANPFYFGAIVGRNANRIADGRLVIDGETFQLTQNDGAHNLHGGETGFNRAVWRAETFERGRERGVTLHHSSAAGEDGFPGLVEARVTYTLTDERELRVEYHARTDAPTPVNLTQHTYWNLGGAGTTTLDHTLQIAAGAFTPVNETLIPLGYHESVTGSPFDLREPRVIGEAMTGPHPQLQFANGYDHNWTLDPATRDTGAIAVRLAHPPSGRSVELYTTEPGVQVYAGGTFTHGLTGKGGVPIPVHGGIAIETQHFPDAPNQPGFPSTILRPGERYESTTVFRFGW